MDTNAYEPPKTPPTTRSAPGGWLLLILALEIFFAALHVSLLVLLAANATTSVDEGGLTTIHWPSGIHACFRYQYLTGMLVRLAAVTALVVFQTRSTIALNWRQWLPPLLIWMLGTGLRYYLNHRQLFAVTIFNSVDKFMLLTIATYVAHVLAVCLLMLAIQQNRKHWQAANPR